MSSEIASIKSPLFTVMEESKAMSYQPLAEDQLQEIQVEIPISLALLDALQQSILGKSMAWKINAILDNITKNEEYLFQDIPVIYEPNGGFLSLVPDNQQMYQINWKEIILQYHLSFLHAEGTEGINSIMRQFHYDNDKSMQTKEVKLKMTQSTMIGSLSRRKQSGCIASFSSRRFGANAPQSIGSFSRNTIPALVREEEHSNLWQKLPDNFDLHVICTLPLQFGMSNPLFRVLIATTLANGFYDISFGYLLLFEYKDIFENINVPTNNGQDTVSVFDTFFKGIEVGQSIDEQYIKQCVCEDNIQAILDIINHLDLRFLSNHTRHYIESIIAPLCYHENPVLAKRATEIYSLYLSCIDVEPQVTKVSTVKSSINIPQQSDCVALICIPMKKQKQIICVKKGVFTPTTTGFYDILYARIASTGEYIVDKTIPSIRYVVIPSTARKEVIHELPAFNDKGPVRFSELSDQLDDLSQSGITAVHVPGAISTLKFDNLTHVVDHCIISKECGGLSEFKEFAERAKSLGMRVLLDFEPVVSMALSSRKYSMYQTLFVDDEDRLVTVVQPETKLQLLNFRSLKFWNLLCDEILTLAEIPGVSGFFLGDIDHWDTVLPRNMNELLKVDIDDNMHYSTQSILQGSVVDINAPEEKCCGMMNRGFKYSPFIKKLMKKLWAAKPDSFVWIQCKKEQESFAIQSGLIPQNNAFTDVIISRIMSDIHADDFNTITTSEVLRDFFEDRRKRLPEGYLIVSPFSSLTTGLANIPAERYQLAVDLLYFMSDVPITCNCTEIAYVIPNGYNIKKVPVLPKKQEKPAKLPYGVKAQPVKPIESNVKKVRTNATKFTACLKNRASSRNTFDWMLGASLDVIKATYNHQENKAIVTSVRTCSTTNRCALITTSFYHSPLIFETNISKLPIFDGISHDSIIEVVPLLLFQNGQGSSNPDKPQYYAYSECAADDSSLFFDIFPYSTNIYEIRIKKPPIEGPIRRTLMEHVFTRLDIAIQHNTTSILANNLIMNQVFDLFEEGDHLDDFVKIIDNLPQLVNAGLEISFRDTLFYATRHIRKNHEIIELTEKEDSIIEKREKMALSLIHRCIDAKSGIASKFADAVEKCDRLGPIFFIAPELGPFSKVGGLSTMVWELAKELVNLGLDISVISPYYNVNNKGETDYLKKYNIEYDSTIDVYAPDCFKIGIHHGVVDGVKLWFVHNYSFFSTPYQTGDASFRLQLLILFAKSSLELLCQKKIIPSLIITNDWMTGLVPTYARQTFGSVFDGTKFLHIFHNLGAGYAGKIWPPNGDTGALHYLHNLPDELIVDNFDHSFDPSLSALLQSDQWATVSKKYRDELLESSPYNYFLRGFEHPFAYSNGIRFQERLQALAKLNMNHAQAKAFIQEKYFGDVDPEKCLLVFVGRIVEQKGVHLIADTFEKLEQQFHGKIQVIVGGKAEADDRTYGAPVSAKLWDLKNRYPRSFWAEPTSFFSDGLVCCHGADFFLVPSQFEPSGIVQQESFASGTPCIAFKTGGLADTVFEFDRDKKTGNGILFWAHRHKDYMMAIERAIALFQEKDLYYVMRKNAYESVLSTETVARAWAREFARLFSKIYQPETQETERPPAPDYANQSKN
jgi:starch synthase